MRLISILLPVAALAAPAAADWGDRGPGLPGVRQGDATVYQASGFDGVAFGLAGSAEVRVGPTWSVRATGPADRIAQLRVVRERNMLQIDDRYRNRDGDPRDRLIHFVVTLPRLDEVALGGSGRITVDQVRGDALNVSVGGSGSLSLGTVAVSRATVSIGGSGGVAAAGTAERLTVNIGGSGGLDAPGLRSRSAEVATAGSGHVRTRVQGPAQVSTVGSGSVDLGPEARCQVTRMGSAQVRCGG